MSMAYYVWAWFLWIVLIPTKTSLTYMIKDSFHVELRTLDYFLYILASELRYFGSVFPKWS